MEFEIELFLLDLRRIGITSVLIRHPGRPEIDPLLAQMVTFMLFRSAVEPPCVKALQSASKQQSSELNLKLT